MSHAEHRRRRAVVAFALSLVFACAAGAFSVAYGPAAVPIAHPQPMGETMVPKSGSRFSGDLDSARGGASFSAT